MLELKVQVPFLLELHKQVYLQIAVENSVLVLIKFTFGSLFFNGKPYNTVFPITV